MARQQTAKERGQRQVANRWTPKLGTAWTPISDYFLSNYHRIGVSHTEAMVVIHIISFKWDDQAPFPAVGTIAKRMGITAQSVRTHIRSLEAKKLLLREIQVGTTNKFHLTGLFNKLEELLADEGRARFVVGEVQLPDFASIE